MPLSVPLPPTKIKIDELSKVFKERMFFETIEFEFNKSKYPEGVRIEKVEYSTDYGVVGLCVDMESKEVFLADIDGFKIEEIIRLPTQIRGVYACDMIYDWKYDTVFIYTCVDYAKNYLYRLSSDLQTVLASLEENVGGGDRGALALTPHPDYYLVYLTDDIDVYTGVIPSDTSVMPTMSKTGFPLRVEAKAYATYNGARGKMYAHDGSCPLIRFGDEFVGFIRLHSGMIELHSSALASYTWDPEKAHMVCGWSPILLSPRHLMFKKWTGTPALIFKHLTDLLGKRFYAIASQLYKNGYVQPLAIPFPEQYILELLKKRIYSLWCGNAISANETSPCIPGWGRKTIFFKSDTSGDLSVYLDPVGRNEWKEIAKETAITEAVIQTTYSGARLRLGFSAGATVTAYVIVEM